MAYFNSNAMPKEGTTFVIGSWVCIANGSSGFNSHLTNSSESKAFATTRCNNVDEFIDQLDEITLSAHVKEIRKQSDFDI